MRILFVSGLTGYSAGGVQTEMVRLVGGMRDRGEEVAFAIDTLPRGLEGVRHFPIAYPPGDAVLELVKAGEEFKPDCIHVVGGGINLLRWVNVMKLPENSSVRWVFTAHNLPPFERISDYFPGRNRLYYWARNARAIPAVMAWKQFLRSGKFSRVIAHSQTVAGHLRDFGCPAGKIVTIPFGCEAVEERRVGEGGRGGDEQAYQGGSVGVGVGEAETKSQGSGLFTPSPTPSVSPSRSPDSSPYPKILTIAGYAHHKGIHDYIEVVARLVPRFPKISYQIVGNSRNKPYTRFLQRRIEELKLTGHVTLLRDASDAVKDAALAAADLYVQPSHEEGFCLAFAEAAMVAPRLIGCRTGEIAGLAADDPTARVVAPKDVNALVAATIELMAMTVPPAAVSGRVERLGGRYSWRNYLARHREMFASVLR